MCRSTEPSERHNQFADEVLQNLLRRIEVENANNAKADGLSSYVFRVSHAWSSGPFIHVVYEAVPLGITWGLARDTRESLIDSGPWNDTDNPALYYYLLDFEEGWPGPLAPQPDEDPDVIRWRGDLHESLPGRVSTLDESWRYTPPPAAGEAGSTEQPPTVTPRRYGNRL
jgi:hypothetical protein